jgi:hypothetical protein
MSSKTMASTGHASTHASQSMHSSGSMYVELIRLVEARLVRRRMNAIDWADLGEA